MKLLIRKVRGGYGLLLMLLVVMVMGCIVFIVSNGGSLFQKEEQKDSSGQLLPWKEENRLVTKEKQVKMPSSPQPPIENTVWYKSYPKEGSDERGEIFLVIDTDGRVRGGWSGDYHDSEGISYSVLSANFAGNVDSSKVYIDEAGRDASKLYIIAKGQFVMLGENKKNNNTFQRQGDIYVTGWVGADYKLNGKITITSDKKYYKVFSLEAWRSEKGLPGIF